MILLCKSVPDNDVYHDNLESIFLLSNKIIYSNPSLESSRRDGPNEGSQHLLLLRNKNNTIS